LGTRSKNSYQEVKKILQRRRRRRRRRREDEKPHGQDEPAPIHWMPVITQLWMNLI
jgi:hypothetical protein